MSVTEEIARILQEKGAGLGQPDLVAIEALVSTLPPEQAIEVDAWISECIANMAMDPLYRGELKLG